MSRRCGLCHRDTRGPFVLACQSHTHLAAAVAEFLSASDRTTDVQAGAYVRMAQALTTYEELQAGVDVPASGCVTCGVDTDAQCKFCERPLCWLCRWKKKDDEPSDDRIPR